MRQWNYLQFSLQPRHLESISAIVAEMGTRGIHEQPLKSGEVLLRAYFDPSSDIGRVHSDFQSRCRESVLPIAACATGVEQERDWLEEWRRDLKPFPVGTRFWIIPGPNVSGTAVRNRISLWLEPQMAFGTGTHESTQLCLETLERLPLNGRAVLDIGTGSGILAIAAAKLGAESVLACDIDPAAIQVARANCRRNRVEQQARLFTGEVEALSGSRFDVVLANLEGKLIRQKLDDFGQLLKPQGCLILSGLLERDAAGLCRSANIRDLPLTLSREVAKGEWRCLVFSRKAHRPA
ncbi:MAG: 50S ribosomal protein L11 methyltransferase [Acidobacteria bacterium]|nr:50S ribosomal protein L11 methyltransferase [Acidobacteriota bacterium]